MLRSTLTLAAAFALMLTFVPPTIAASPQTKCKVTKLNAATKKLASKVKCYTNALKKSVPIDQSCLAKAEQKFADAFARVEAKTKGGCAVTGEGQGVEASRSTISFPRSWPTSPTSECVFRADTPA